ncbi:MAG: serine/threonine-protein kinase [Planctomycetota bacterium]|nr:serine/threonine-protein kinase [Planctomycetota bacterium]
MTQTLYGKASSGKLPQVGMVLDGFQILDLLGMGGMGAVYKVEKQGALYALKVILDPAENDLQRFEREAISLAAAKHTNIVQVHTMKANGTWPYILFEFVEGEDLSSKIADGQPWSLEDSLRVLRPLASALDEIHSRRIIHRDLKPANILIRSSDNKPLLTDFGIAKNQDLDTLTQQGEIVGTISYMAPEQLSGEAVSAQTDLWALGVILYQLLSGGELPFRGTSLIELAQKIMTKEPRPIGDFVSSDSESLSNLFCKALAKDPERRYKSAEDLIEDCERVLRGEAMGAKAPRRFQSLYILGSIVIALLLSMAAVYQQGIDWRAAKEREAKLLGQHFQQLNSDLPVHYLDHCLSLTKELKCCAEYEELNRLAMSFEQELEESAHETFSWKDPGPFQRSLIKLRPSIASLAIIHSKKLKESQLDKDQRYKHAQLLKAAIHFSKEEYSEANEIYAGLKSFPDSWRNTVNLMKASCAFRLGDFERADGFIQSLRKIPGLEPYIAKLKRSVQLNLSVEELFKSTRGIDKPRAMLSRLSQSEANLVDFFSEWSELFQSRYNLFKPEKYYMKEDVYRKHRDLSYEFPLIKRLDLTEGSLQSFMKSALGRNDKRKAFLYCARIRVRNPRFPIPKELSFGFDERGRINFSQLYAETQRKGTKSESDRARYEQFQFVLEAGRQGIYLEAFDGLRSRNDLSLDPAIMALVRKSSTDPFLLFCKGYIELWGKRKRDSAPIKDLDFAFNHNKTPGFYKAIALTEQARRLLDQQGTKHDPTTSKRCRELIAEARKYAHPRPERIELLSFSVLLHSCTDQASLRREEVQLEKYMTKAKLILTLRKDLTVAGDLTRGRPAGQPLSSLSTEFELRMAGCDMSLGLLYFRLGKYPKALPKLVKSLSQRFERVNCDRLVLCIERTPDFVNFGPILNFIGNYEQRSEFKGEDRTKLQAFKAKVLALKGSRE